MMTIKQLPEIVSKLEGLQCIHAGITKIQSESKNLPAFLIIYILFSSCLTVAKP